ncbi:hypothetical protein C0Z17_06730 [Trinickia caryophylli]|nr:hypothetical protein C0Z17_06730 [Trinickia caryophylli]
MNFAPRHRAVERPNDAAPDSSNLGTIRLMAIPVSRFFLHFPADRRRPPIVSRCYINFVEID